MVRFSLICQFESDFNEANDILSKALYPRGYSHRFLRTIKSNIKSKFLPADGVTGMQPCKGKRCRICKYVRQVTEIPNSKLAKPNAYGKITVLIMVKDEESSEFCHSFIASLSPYRPYRLTPILFFFHFSELKFNFPSNSLISYIRLTLIIL